jgi:hypothetical protein
MENESMFKKIRKAIKHPIRAMDEVAFNYIYRLPVSIINSFYPIGTNVFDKEWDMLIILDTCRVDALKEIKDEYSFIQDIGRIRSVGGSSPEWIARTFDKNHVRQVENTTYISANGFAERVLKDRYQSRSLTPLHRSLSLVSTVTQEAVGDVEYVFDHEPVGENGPRGHKQGATPPEYVTDKAIEYNRKDGSNRLILHYHQPHSPWTANALADDRRLRQYENDWWTYLTKTEDVETVWESYLSDLRYVLDDVETLLENVDADKVIISADHGEAFGEYGILGHKIGSLHPKIRMVPWMVTTAEDTHSYTPTIEESSTMSDKEIDTQLEALGYKL